MTVDSEATTGRAPEPHGTPPSSTGALLQTSRPSVDPAGDHWSPRFDECFQANYARVLAYCLRRLGDRAAAEDVAAQTFLVAWRRRDQMPADQLPWLLGIARHSVLNERRRGRRRERLVSRLAAEPTPEGDGSEPAPGTPTELHTALARLSESDREVLLLTTWDGLDQRRAAAVFGCSSGAFKMRLHRARKRLARAGHRPDRPRGELMKTNPEAAIALLERSDPVQLDGLMRPDELQLARAEVELRSAAAADVRTPSRRPSRRKVRRTVVLVGAAVVVAGCVLLALPGSKPHDGGVLSEAAALAAQQPPTIAPAGEYYYLEEHEVQSGLAGASTENVQWWVANDGSGRVATTLSANGLRNDSASGRFGSGGYDSVAYPNPADLVGHRGVPIPFMIGSLVPLGMSFDPETLPADPAALSDALVADVARAARLEPHGLYAESRVPEATKELMLIANALQDPMDTPALRSALFTLAGELPGIAVQQGVTDPLGRSGEAITASEGVAVEADGRLNPAAQETFAVIFDPTTTQILAETQYPSDHPEQMRNWYVVFTGQVDVPTDTTTQMTTTPTTASPTTTTPTTAG